MRDRKAALSGAPPLLLPRRRPIARLYAGIALALLGRAFRAASRLDPGIRSELAGLPVGYSFALGIHPAGPELRLRIGEGGAVENLAGGRAAPAAPPELLMEFRSLEAGLGVLTFSASAFETYAKGGLAIRGDLGATMAVIRALGLVETLLLPAFVARRVLKRPARMGTARLWRERILLYLALPFAAPRTE